AQLLPLLALPPHSKKVMGSIPAWGAVGSGGQVLPRVHSAQVGHLPGLSVWSLHVDKGFSPLTTPTEKTCKITEHMSIPDQIWTVHFTWSPGATSCPLLLGGPSGSAVREGKKQKLNSPRSQAYLRVCVSCVASIYARVCSSVSCVPIKT